TEFQPDMRAVLREYRHAKDNALLLLLPFVTVTDYLHELRALAKEMRPLGPDAMFYLAAAVSDFFIPRSQMAEHKIQSTNESVVAAPAAAGTGSPSQRSACSGISSPGGTSKIPHNEIYTGYNDDSAHPAGTEQHEQQALPAHQQSVLPLHKKLVIHLDPVPKFLTVLVNGWAPEGSMIVSFKLETDPSLLISKAEQAINRYSHHLVIGNLLSTRKYEVVFVGRDERGEIYHHWIKIPRPEEGDSAAAGGGHQEEVEIESKIVPELKQLHSQRIERFAKARA
ncbi:hypothetical protein KEM52_002795, partial [Ascosphaera acerosa]